MPDEDVDKAKRQHYRANFSATARFFVVTFKGYPIAGQGDVSEF